jgi:hypothetical protein
MNYEVRFGMLPAKSIYNFLGPCPARNFQSLEEKTLAEEQAVASRNSIDGFYERLEKSILEDGMNDPVIINSGHVPDTIKTYLPDFIVEKFIDNLLICYQIGGSRLWIAQKHDMVVPCLINDHNNRFPHFETLRTPLDILWKYKSSPSYISFMNDAVWVKATKNTEWCFKRS